MKLSLTTWQRINLCLILSSIEGKVSIVRKASKLLDVLELSDAEKELVGYREESGSIGWDDRTTHFDLEITDPNLFAFLSERVKEYVFPKQTWGNSEVRRLILDMYDQLGIKEE